MSSVEIKANYEGEYLIKEEYRPIAKKLKQKFQELKHVPVEQIIFIERQEKSETHANKTVYAKIMKIPNRYKDLLQQLTKKDFTFIMEIFRKNTTHLTREQLITLIYHELRHIQLVFTTQGATLKIVGHDIEDWSELVRKLGSNWCAPGKSLPDLLDDSIINWSSIEDPQVTFVDMKLQLVK